MSKRIIVIGVSAAALALGITAAQAASNKGAKTHSAASLACSQQANAKGLHGKARKRFREHCKRQFTQGSGYKSGKSYNYKPEQGFNPMQGQGYKGQTYKPMQGQGYKPMQDQSQGQGGNPKKWW